MQTQARPPSAHSDHRHPSQRARNRDCEGYNNNDDSNGAASRDIEKDSANSLVYAPTSASDSDDTVAPLFKDHDENRYWRPRGFGRRARGEHRGYHHFHHHRRRPLPLIVLRRLVPLLALLSLYFIFKPTFDFPFPPKPAPPLPPFVQEGIDQCKILQRPPPSPKPFDAKRKVSDRFVPGTGAVWLKNATLWTGEDDGNEVLYGASVLLENGVIRKVGDAEDVRATAEGADAEVVELDGAWVTPGIVDMHSHLALDSVPELEGSDDTNSLKSAVLPWLRSLDGFNTHDLAFNLSIAGGITTMLVLPGSAGNIGGQAFVFKPRWTYENTPQSMQVEPPFVIDHSSATSDNLTSSSPSWRRTHSWRYMKHACGENPARVYGNTRMDSAYDFRRAYTEGKTLKDAQDRWCASPSTQTEALPTSLEWEALADVIRGHVKVNVHCYETTDLNVITRLSNEFEFPIAAFHHAHETYLVPDLLKQTYGPPPSIAIFATNARYKREAYRGSEFAPKILADAGLNVCMKSDHPVLDSRYLVYEAAQAHHYGLNFSQAIGSVTTHPARAIGMDHRMGYVKVGYDADIVVWDSFPLALGATPKQTYIDGIPQIIDPHVTEKPASAQEISPAGEYDDEAAEAIRSRGDPDLRPKRKTDSVLFTGINDMFIAAPGAERLQGQSGNWSAVVEDGQITCVGECEHIETQGWPVIDLKGGSIAPGLVSVGSFIGVMEIRQEEVTWDGTPYDPLSDSGMLDGLLVRAVDGAQFGGKDELLAYRAGVTTGVASPISDSLFAGVSFAFSTGAEHALEKGAILDPDVALHLNLNNQQFSTSTKMALLRRLFTKSAKSIKSATSKSTLVLGGDDEEEEEESELQKALTAVAAGERRLVVAVNKADIIASLIRLKREVAPKAKITIIGGAESWMVAEDLAKEDIGVIVVPARSFPLDWDSRRIVPGPPLSKHTLPSYLASHGVTVGLGINEEWMARNTRYDAAWAYASSPDTFTKQAAIALVSTNLEKLLDIDTARGMNKGEERSWVAYEGDMFSLNARVRAVRSMGANRVDLF